MHILVVEDDAPLAKIVKKSLESGGHTVDVAVDGQAGLDLGRQRSHDAVVLDIQLPKVNGMDVCRMLREDGNHVPIIMLTARTSEDDRVTGLELGADDYVTKPFSLRELSARVRAVLRRSTAKDDRPMLAYRGDHLMADFEAVSVTVDGDSIRLTRREFELLRYLVQNKNRVVSRDRLLERVWGYDRSVETRSVDVHVGRLRSKLGDASKQIETVIGLGYRFVD